MTGKVSPTGRGGLPTSLGSMLSRVVQAASLVVGAVGLVWLIERVFLVWR